MRVLVLVSLAACSFPEKHFVSGDAQQSDGRRTADAAPDALPGFECRGVPLPTTAPAVIRISGTMFDSTGMNPVVGATVMVLDANNGVLGQATNTDANGNYSIDLNSNGVPIDGHVYVTGPNLMPTAAWRSAPYATDTSVILGLEPTTFAPALANAAGTNYNPADAIVLTYINDCDNHGQAGAMMTNPQPGGATMRYQMGSSLPASATSTDSSGTVYLVNVAPGSVPLIAVLADGMKQYSRTVQLNGGELDYTALQPSP